jgi:hypothetical protein
VQQRHAPLEAGLDAWLAAGGKVDVAQALRRGAGVLVPCLGGETGCESAQHEGDGEWAEHEYLLDPGGAWGCTTF